MTLSEELAWRGFVNQTTFKDNSALDGEPLTFYWGVDPSAPSMTIGNLAAAMMVRHFIDHGHKAILLVGGATGMIGDPDGKAEERSLKTLEEIGQNKAGLVEQYKKLFVGKPFEVVDNYEWFQNMKYLDFLRDIGKHVPMRQMMNRNFVQTRLSEEGAGISYAEFSYVLIQAYDFLHLNKEKDVTLQLCGSDQWGNSIAGVELIRRINDKEAHVWSTPLVINKVTGKKFGKSEEGAVWLDPKLTTPTQFYQFWINCDDLGVEDYLKIYTLLSKEDIEQIMDKHRSDPKLRHAQQCLAEEVTTIVHGEDGRKIAEEITKVLNGKKHISELTDPAILAALRSEIRSVKVKTNIINNVEPLTVTNILVEAKLAQSLSEARRLLKDGGIYINNRVVLGDTLHPLEFTNGRLLLRRGKKLKDTALVEYE